MQKTISIIGGGIAGLTAAIALRQKGIPAVIFEAAPEIKAVGAGLALSANAMKVFHLLGLMEGVVARGKLLSKFSVLDKRGKVITVADSAAISLQFGLDNFLIHRASLHEFLLSKLEGQEIFTNKKAVRFQESDGKIEVFFEDGSSFTSDHVIAAEGIHSRIRKQLLPQSQIRYSGYTCWRGLMDSNQLDIHESSETWGPKGRFGIAPLADNQLYWFACINASQNDPKMKAMTVRGLLEIFKDYHAPIPQILEHTKEENLLWNDILDLQPIHQYAFGKIVLIGDAAHATTPNLGQGACQSIEDAYILAEEVSRSINMETAFLAFEKRRIKRCQFIVNTSWQIGKVAQWENPLLCKTRDFVFRSLPESISSKQMEKVLKTDF